MVRAACSASTVSPVMGRRCGSAPSARVAASSAQALLLRTWPARMLALISTISSPVGTMAALARGWARTAVTPTDPSTPISAGPRRRPAWTTTAPALMSPPAGRTFSPESARSSTATSRRSVLLVRGSVPRWPQSVRSVSSKGTTASAPAGTGAPVMIRAASPGCSVTGAHSAGGNFVHYPQLRGRGRGRLG